MDTNIIFRQSYQATILMNIRVYNPNITFNMCEIWIWFVLNLKMIPSLIFGLTELSRSELTISVLIRTARYYEKVDEKCFMFFLEHRRGMKCDEIKEFRWNVEQNVKIKRTKYIFSNSFKFILSYLSTFRYILLK